MVLFSLERKEILTSATTQMNFKNAVVPRFTDLPCFMIMAVLFLSPNLKCANESKFLLNRAGDLAQ